MLVVLYSSKMKKAHSKSERFFKSRLALRTQVPSQDIPTEFLSIGNIGTHVTADLP